MNIDGFTQFVARAPWTFAKTMPKHPHFYTLLKANDSSRFPEAVMFIRENGYPKSYLGKEYIYYDSGEYSYWTMGSPLDQTILINRAAMAKS